MIVTQLSGISWNAQTRQLAIDNAQVAELRRNIAQSSAQNQAFFSLTVNEKEYRASVDGDGKIQVRRNWEGVSLLSRLFKPFYGHCSQAIEAALNKVSKPEHDAFMQERRECNRIYAENFSQLCAELRHRVERQEDWDLSGLFRVPGNKARMEATMRGMERGAVDFSEMSNDDLAGIIKRSKMMVDISQVKNFLVKDKLGKEISICYGKAIRDSHENKEQRRCKELAVSTIAFCYSRAAETGEFSKYAISLSAALFDSKSSNDSKHDEDALLLRARGQELTGAILENWPDSANRPPVAPKPKLSTAENGAFPPVKGAEFGNVIAQLESVFANRGSV
ncbi:hypothetical protein C2134_00580 [Chromobacterium sinusclupearum]|uniref:Uncharacterized protein n=1 Tax=Chromobacterium sinusclupearum TaxID=2077146 RepID=A0A2K4MUC4_9NEIS|nr:hypothetical protein [Chromobacterium sinusclupearum]POB00598.1 hypothetical protein C2134_00580 [Chromobacterium sinusclupearum]